VCPGSCHHEAQWLACSVTLPKVEARIGLLAV
jgi:hypothetical protein